MKLAMDFPQKWKMKSTKDQIPLSDILYGYAVENLMQRIEASSFWEYLWLTNEQAVGESAYRKNTKERLEYIYIESGKKNFQNHAVAGQPFDHSVLALFLEEVFSQVDMRKEELADVEWEYNVGEMGNGVYLLLNGSYMGMKVPITMRLDVAHVNTQSPKKKELSLLFDRKRTCSYYIYSKESVLSESLFEIMRKLELISDMETYDTVNEILKSQTISGRHVVEDFLILGKKEPKVASMRRLAQMKSYRDYSYMKKKWKQYEKKHKEYSEDWEDVMDRLLAFLEPIWIALCEDEIFLDDWMPELGRFLG